MVSLEVSNITKSFGKTEVLKGISFSLEKGQVLAIIGSSGSGKTTLLRCLNFLETPNRGTISVNGKVLYNSEDKATLSDEAIRQNRLHFGLVFQNFNLFPHYNVLENITLAPNLLNMGNPEENKENAMRLLKSQLYEIELRKRQEEVMKVEAGKKKIEWGSQIRSYVLQPYKLVKDVRTAYETGNVQAVLDGDIDGFIKAYLMEFGGE